VAPSVRPECEQYEILAEQEKAAHTLPVIMPIIYQPFHLFPPSSPPLGHKLLEVNGAIKEYDRIRSPGAH
jgi:hypothetical protein